MRKYQRTYKVDSAEVQGAGSYVVFKNLTWGEARPVFEQSITVAEAALLRVVEWNWTDDNDQPIPLPASVDDLMSDEVMFLVRHASRGMSEEDAKN